MENPLEAQKAIYGHDGPPMIFAPETSALDLEKSGSVGSIIINDDEIKSQKGKKECAQVKEEEVSQELSPCQLPGDFPPELSFRALAVYSLLRTLSIQLRLSPFTPNVFLRALYLPIPNPIIGQIHVALLRILLVKKLPRSMGYSYKPKGGEMGVHKRRQMDNLRWPLIAGDNLTNLDTFSWPLFFDDYSHLTADRLWANYHGRIDDRDDFDEKSHFINFRNILSSVGVEKKCQHRTFDQGFNATNEKIHTEEADGQLPFTSTSIVGGGVELETTVIDDNIFDTEDEYEDDEKNGDNTDAWKIPKPKKKRRRSNPNNNPTTFTSDARVAAKPKGGLPISTIAATEEFSLTPKPQISLPSASPRQPTTQFQQSQSQLQLQSQSKPQLHVLPSRADPNHGYPATYDHQSRQSHVVNFSSVTNKNSGAQHKPTVQPPQNPSVSKVAHRYIHNNDYNKNIHTNYNVPTAVSMPTYTSHNIVADVPMTMESEIGMNAPVSLALAGNNPFLSSIQKKEISEVKQSSLDDGLSQQETRTQHGEPDTNIDTNIYNEDDPLRIRGGGRVEDVDITQNNRYDMNEVTVHSNGNDNKINPTRSRGLPGLPIHNINGPSRRSLPMHRGQSITSQQQQYQQYHQQQYQQQQLYHQYYHQQQHHDFQQQQQQMYHAHQLQMQQQFRTVQTDIESEKPKQISYTYQAASKGVSAHRMHSRKTTEIKQAKKNERPEGPLKVSNGIAQVINDFVSGVRVKRKAEEIEVIDDDNDLNNDDLVDKDCDIEMKRWLHFKPLKAMRSGVPYHRLPIEEKLYILEFLTDELLTVDAISEEFTRRHMKTDCHDFPYGRLPKEEEYDSIENNDECAVCLQEGDLLCCDGCVSSYHSDCLNMIAGETIAEGKWLCPECKLVDPCNFGPLRGGRKSSLDWFALDDILNVSTNQHGVHGLSSFASPHKSESHELSNFQSKILLQNPTANIINGNRSNQPCIELCGDGAMKTSTISKDAGSELKWKEMEFIIVHGFVFSRKRSGNIRDTIETMKSSKPYLTMTRSDLVSYLSQTHARLTKSWPLAQIPYTEKFRSNNFPSVRVYFASAESVNPFHYNNKYRSAPVCSLMKAGVAHQIVKLMLTDYESHCNQPNTSKVSKLMIEDMSRDAKISSNLKTQTDLFNPYQLLKGYMVRLEQILKKSCMLNEFWLGGKLRTKSEIWISSVRSAKSIRGLGRLLLTLVNEIHPRAFSVAWFQSHVTKHSDLDNSMSERNYKSLPADWNEEKEMLKRIWETTPSHLIEGLCSNDGNDLMTFASEIRSDIFIAKSMNVIKSKRKLKKTSPRTEKRTANAGDHTELYHEEGTQSQRQSEETENSISKSGIDIIVSANQQQNPPIDTSISTNSLVIDVYKKETNDQIPQKLKHIYTKVEVVEGPICHVEKKIVQELILETSQENQENNAHSPIDVLTEKLDQMPQESNHNHTKVELVEDPACHIDTQIIEDTTLQSPNIFEGNQANNSSIIEDPARHIKIETVQDLALQSPKIYQENQANNATPPNATKPKRKRGRPPKSAIVGKSKSKNKIPQKLKEREPTPRRRTRTRHSGRLSSEHHSSEKSRDQNDLGRKQPTQYMQLDTSISMTLQIENAKKQKIPDLEKLLKGIYIGQGSWPIAGRKFFPTIGNLPPSEMRKIARNAGKVLAVNLNYHSSHEVAQVCYGHIWRKRVDSCCRFEELCFLIRILDSSLDREMIQMCENTARRGKSGIQKVIRCSITNRSNGSLEHFVVNKKSMKGCWVPAEHLDVSSLMLELLSRRQTQIKKRQEFLRIKEYAERQKAEKDRIRRVAEAAKKAEEEHRKRVVMAEARKAAKMKKREEAAKKKLKKEAQKTAKMMAVIENKKSRQSAAKEAQTVALNQEIAKWKNEKAMAFSMHEMQVKYTLQSWRNLGKSNVPEANIVLLRKQTLEKLRLTNERLRRCNIPIMDTQQLMEVMFELEKKAASDVTSNVVAGAIVSKGFRQSRPIDDNYLKNATNVMLHTQPIMTQLQSSKNNDLPSTSSGGGNCTDKNRGEFGLQRSSSGQFGLTEQSLQWQQEKSFNTSTFNPKLEINSNLLGGVSSTGNEVYKNYHQPNTSSEFYRRLGTQSHISQQQIDSGSNSRVLPSPDPLGRAHNQIKHQSTTTDQQQQFSMEQGMKHHNQQYHTEPSSLHATNDMEVSQSDGPPRTISSGSHLHTVPSEQHHHKELTSGVTSPEGHAEQYTGINHVSHRSQSSFIFNQRQVNSEQQQQSPFTTEGFTQQQQQGLHNGQHLTEEINHAKQTITAPSQLGNFGFTEPQQILLGHQHPLTQSQEAMNRQSNNSFSVDYNVQQNNTNSYSMSQEQQQQMPYHHQNPQYQQQEHQSNNQVQMQMLYQQQYLQSQPQEQKYQEQQSNDRVVNSLEQQFYKQQQILQQLQQQYTQGQFNPEFNNNFP